MSKIKGSTIVIETEKHRLLEKKAALGHASKIEWMISSAAHSFCLNALETRHVLVEKDFTKGFNGNKT